MSDENEFYEVHFHEISHETDKAYLINIHGDDSDGLWFPKSQVKEMNVDRKTFEIPTWIAEKKELI